MEAEPGPEDNGRREHERQPLPALELEAGHHRDDGQRGREEHGDGQPRPDRLREIPGGGPLVRQRGVVPHLLDGRDEVVDRDRGRVVGDRRGLGRVVDGRLDSLEPVQLALDARRARGAGHPVDVETDTLGLLSRRRHTPMIPLAGMCWVTM